MNRKSNGLIALLVCAGLAYLLLYLGLLPGVLQVVLGLLVVCVLPGYLFSEAFFPTLGNVQRLTLTLGFSFVLVILTGFLLHVLGLGLAREMWVAVSFYGLILALGVLALFRASRQTDSSDDLQPLIMPRLHEPLLVLIAVGVAVTALSLASGASQRQRTPITQLWITPQGDSVTIGLASNEDKTFRLEVKRDGEELFNELVATPDATSKTINLKVPESYHLLGATLYLPGSDIPYRRVMLW